MPDTIVLEPVGESIKAARDFVAKIVTSLGMDDYLPRLVVSELVANAWQHASTEGNVITVHVFKKCDQTDEPPNLLVIEVQDQSDLLPVVQIPSEAATAGRGLLLLSHLTVRWGTRPVAEGGKVVFAEMTA
jgi:anti-sigma regulatory factor (Ser/Thr protein kinase)